MNRDCIRILVKTIILVLISLPNFLTTTQAQRSTSALVPEVIILTGDIDVSGHFTFRKKFPSGYSSRPHFYTTDHHITVLRGSIYIAYGKKMDRTGAIKLDAGSFITIPAKQNHYEWTDEETLLQVYGMGPAQEEFKKISRGTDEILKHDVYDTPVELTPGQNIVPVHGDITTNGLYCFRLRIAAGTNYAPHRHPFDQYVTILKGTLIIGYGESPDTIKMDTLKVGSFLCINERRIHYEKFPEETIVQIHGPGPLQTEFIKPVDK